MDIFHLAKPFAVTNTYFAGNRKIDTNPLQLPKKWSKSTGTFYIRVVSCVEFVFGTFRVIRALVLNELVIFYFAEHTFITHPCQMTFFFEVLRSDHGSNVFSNGKGISKRLSREKNPFEKSREIALSM